MNSFGEKYSEWLRKIENIQASVIKNFDTSGYPNKVLGPANSQEIEAVELKLGMSIPEELKSFFTSVSKYTYMAWDIDDEYELPSGIEDIKRGGIEMGLSILENMNLDYRDAIEKYYYDTSDGYNQTLNNKFVFHTTWTGDFFAIDLNEAKFGSVVYLSYNEAPGHNHLLGKTFHEFIYNWLELGFAGPDGSALRQFMKDDKSGLIPNCENAQLLKKLIIE